jgi:Peptidase A4 family
MKVKSSLAVAAAVAMALALTGLTGSVSANARPVTRGTLRPAIHLARHAAVSPQGIPIDYSGNWSGYVATPKSGGASSFKYVSASYSVPSVNCSVTSYAFSYHWAGLDGWLDSTVEQDGVGSFCVSGTPDYFAWYEMYPAGVTVEFSVNPGDAITSSVKYTGGEYTLALTDQTTGQSFSTRQACAGTCDNSSAEVITEGYTASPYAGTADFGEEHYDSAVVQGNVGKGGLVNAKWNTTESIAVGGTTGGIDTEPGPLYKATGPAESAFPLTWIAED